MSQPRREWRDAEEKRGPCRVCGVAYLIELARELLDHFAIRTDHILAHDKLSPWRRRSGRSRGTEAPRPVGVRRSITSDSSALMCCAKVGRGGKSR
jgi:hypothetical protein